MMVILVSVWAPAFSVAQQATAYNYAIFRDIPYRSEGSDYARERRWELDLYLPKDRENFPVLVWFHGGALKFSSKNDIYATSVAKRFASEGIGVVLPGYRLYPQVKYPEFIEDAASAVAWVYHNISTYHGNPEHLFIGGHSSGAYLAAMIGMDERYLKKHQLSLQQIVGVIPLSGEMYGDSTVWSTEHGIYKTIRDETTTFQVDETTPMFYVRRDVPPFLCMCAEYAEDPPEIVCAENQKFIEALRATGHKHVTFKEIPDRTHFSVSEMKSPDDPVVKLMLSFIQKAISGE
ncbi:MAG: alpha/beta hydrolase [Gammaproteobacteria bacterium]|nr:alpha/beta hydrolase [Gammaproteobacteria bacterium]